MPRATDTRERILDTSVRLFRRQGYSATGLKQIASEGRAPFGSIYHFFPGGKEQIAVESLRRAGAGFEELGGRLFARSGDMGSATELWFTATADALEASDYRDGCPIGTIAQEVAVTSEVLRAASAEILAGWETVIANALASAGVGDPDARRLASFALSVFEGALLISRAKRNTEPLRLSARLVADAVRAAMP